MDGIIRAHLIPHDKLEFSRAKLPLCITQVAIVRDARKVRRCHVYTWCEVLQQQTLSILSRGRAGG